ncbi:CDP-alcohol phosphatidyltransferase family protein [Elusimicrobiota bacterium]
MTLANKITILRIILIPVFIIFLVRQQHPWPLVIYTFTIATDALDGFIARWKHQSTALGTFLDPMGDKFLIVSGFLVLALLKIVPFWIFVLIISRDIIIVLGWVIIYFLTGSRTIKTNVWGKISTVFQMGTIWFILMQIPDFWINKLLLITVATTVISGLAYIWQGTKRLNNHA